ncbi:methyltransferase [Nonomuraea sp. NPDC004702]
MLLEHLRDRSATAAALISELDPHDVEKVIDVGGHGIVLTALLTRHPRLKGMLLNSHLTAETRAQLHHDDVLIRWHDKRVVDVLRGGVPMTYRPLFLLDSVLCQLGDQQALDLLRHMVAGMTGVGRAELWLIEPALPRLGLAQDGLSVDLWWMALTPQGRVRNPRQHRELLRRAGWPSPVVRRLNRELILITARLPLPP